MKHGIHILGTVHSHYRKRTEEGYEKLPCVQYIDPFTENIEYLNSEYDKNKWFSRYEIGEQVDLIYMRKKGRTIVKIYDKKQLYNDGLTNIFVGVITLLILLLLVFSEYV
jgi:hypothetical protein